MTRIDIMAGGKDSEPAPYSVLQAIMTLRHAIMAKSGGWNDAEAERVRAIVEKAARDIVGPDKK